MTRLDADPQQSKEAPIQSPTYDRCRKSLMQAVQQNPNWQTDDRQAYNILSLRDLALVVMAAIDVTFIDYGDPQRRQPRRQRIENAMVNLEKINIGRSVIIDENEIPFDQELYKPGADGIITDNWASGNAREVIWGALRDVGLPTP